jgi:GTP cyclohydrolase I
MNHMSNLKDALHIPDTQSERDERHLAIQRVGVKDVRYPVELRIGKSVCRPVAQWDLDVALPAEQKGNAHVALRRPGSTRSTRRSDARRLRSGLAGMLERLHAAEGRIEARFPFFLRKRAPVSGVAEPARIPGAAGSPRRAAAEARCGPRWSVPVKSLCPCSKEISDYGAHNQRSHVTIRVELKSERLGRPECASTRTARPASIWRC